MADTKKAPVAKAAPKKVAKVAPKTSDKSVQEQLVEKRADYLTLQKSHAAGELVNPRALTYTRKEIARLMTTLNADKEAK